MKIEAIFLSPFSLFAMVLAVAFTGERINLPIGIGTFVIVAGLYLVITSK